MTAKQSDLRDLILNSREPLLIRNIQLDWKCFDKTALLDWCKRFDYETKKPVQFERNSIKCGNTPQWERNREVVSLEVQRFFEEHSVEQDFWTGLQYKRTQELPAPCVEGIDFGCFGFEDAADDATLWLSAKGANTPCHYDTYGCNIVCQQYGRKSWLLLPPGTPLTTCRVPYEESSVYCKENLYAPQSTDVANLCHKLRNFAYHCILDAGDVLIVPRHWWHFVEALDISLSVNAWLPLAVDIEAQLDECIVKYIMESIVRQNSLTTDVVNQLLNPNQLNLATDEPQLLQLIQHLCNKIEVMPERLKKTTTESVEQCYPYQRIEPDEVQILMRRIPNVEKLTCMTEAQLREFLERNSQRFDKQFVEADKTCLNVIREELLNSICKPNVIAQIRTEFCKRLNDL